MIWKKKSLHLSFPELTSCIFNFFTYCLRWFKSSIRNVFNASNAVLISVKFLSLLLSLFESLLTGISWGDGAVKTVNFYRHLYYHLNRKEVCFEKFAKLSQLILRRQFWYFCISTDNGCVFGSWSRIHRFTSE